MQKQLRKYAHFHERLKAALHHRQLSIHDLAKAANVSYEMARRYCAGEGIPRDRKRINKIASILQVEVDWLMDGVGPGLGPKKQTYVPLFTLDDKELSWSSEKWKGRPSIPSPYPGFHGIAVQMPVPMGCTTECHGIKLFKQGDVLYLTPADKQPDEHTVVVVEKKKRTPGRRYFVRKVKYQSNGNGIEMSFASANPESFADLHLNEYRIFGVVDAVSARLKQANA